MSNHSAVDLLREALALLDSIPNQALPDHSGRASSELTARIALFLAQSDRSASADLVHETRERWKNETGVRIDDRAIITTEATGLWISAWLRVGTPVAPTDRDAYQRALGALPALAREVFLLNRQDGLDYNSIGQRLGLSRGEVEREFSTALVGLHRHIYGDRP
ncbi:sigma factor-like helix-turn-helix DNA-binding protein [Sphingomonas oryzagri]